MESTTKTNCNSIKTNYVKTSCYFCNEWLDSQSFKEHIIHCGQMLVECESCTAYIQRKKIRKHSLECPKSKSRDNKSDENEDLTLDFVLENRLTILEQDIKALRTVLNEEIKQRLYLITDVGSLRKHNQILNEWSEKVSNALPSLKKCITEEEVLRNSEVATLHQEIQKVHNENIIYKDCQIKINNQLNELEADINRYEEKIKSLEQNFEDRLNMITTLLDTIEKDLNKKFIKNSELNFEVKSMKNIVCETEEKCDRFENYISNMEVSIQKTNQIIIGLENNLVSQCKFSSIMSHTGHIIWKITDYSKELEKARLFDGLSIQGPIFLNKPFGYTLRLEVFLNGIGKWKGRNLFACLNVISGEYDEILQWPCRLKADIILKDQNSPYSVLSSEAFKSEENMVKDGLQDYIKSTIVKKKKDDYHSNQYIHISHKTINTRNYLKNDSIFIEIKVHKF